MLILQMTGLSGAGKTTLAQALKIELDAMGIPAEVIDADEYRKTVSKDLGFSADDRKENIRRLGAVAEIFRQQGKVAIIAAINPFEEVRRQLREQLGATVIWIRCALDVLILRDTKGLYQRALLPAGDPQKLWNLTGVNDVYEEPLSADLIISTDNTGIEAATKNLIRFVLANRSRSAVAP